MRDNFSYGAGGRTDARRPKPGGKNRAFSIYPKLRKGTRAHFGNDRKHQKTEPQIAAKVKGDVHLEENKAYFGKRSGPAPGSLEYPCLRENTSF